MPTSGTVHFLKGGSASLTALCEGRVSNPCAVTVSEPPPPPGGLYPNIGICTTPLLAWQPTQCVAGDGVRLTGGVTVGGLRHWGGADQSRIISIAGPNGETTAFRYIWPVGTPPGTNPDLFTSDEWADAREVYNCWYLRFPDASFKFHSVGGMKLYGFIGVAQKNSAGEGGSNNRFILTARANATPATLTNCVAQLQGWPPIYYSESYAAPYYITMGGAWHRLEFRCRMNSAEGVTDGRFRVWLDGVLKADWNNVPYMPSPVWDEATQTYKHYTHGFFNWFWQPTWGGNGGPNLDVENHFDLARLYISGSLT